MNDKFSAITKLIKVDRRPSEILPELYIGSIVPMIFTKELNALGITHVLSAVNGVKPLIVFFHLTAGIKTTLDPSYG